MDEFHKHLNTLEKIYTSKNPTNSVVLQYLVDRYTALGGRDLDIIKRIITELKSKQMIIKDDENYVEIQDISNEIVPEEKSRSSRKSVSIPPLDQRCEHLFMSGPHSGLRCENAVMAESESRFCRIHIPKNCTHMINTAKKHRCKNPISNFSKTGLYCRNHLNVEQVSQRLTNVRGIKIHTPTGLVFTNDQVVYGKMSDDGEQSTILNDTDFEAIKSYKFKFDVKYKEAYQEYLKRCENDS